MVMVILQVHVYLMGLLTHPQPTPFPNVSKWLDNANIHQPRFNFFGDSKCNFDAQATQVLKFHKKHSTQPSPPM